MKPRLLITGGSSSLGREIVRQATPAWQVIATYWNQPSLVPPCDWSVRLDLRDEESVRRCIAEHRPQAIIHTAGSNRPQDFEQLIVQGSQHIAQQAAQTGARLVHLSTDAFFDGSQAPYTESATPKPLHAYGRAKAAAEEIVKSSQANAVIVRTSLIYSLTGEDHTTRWLLDANASGEPITLFIDEFRSAVWVKSLASACLELARHPYQGVLNVAGSQSVDRWELGSKLLQAMGVSRRNNIQPGRTPENLIGRRPQDITLDISLAQRILKTPLPGLDQVLDLTGANPGS